MSSVFEQDVDVAGLLSELRKRGMRIRLTASGYLRTDCLIASAYHPETLALYRDNRTKIETYLREQAAQRTHTWTP